MSAIDSIGISYLDPAISRALVPVDQGKGAHNQQNPQPQTAPVSTPLAVSPAQRQGLETRAELLQQRVLTDQGNANRSQHALRAYKSLEDREEREEISRLLGVDEYA